MIKNLSRFFVYVTVVIGLYYLATYFDMMYLFYILTGVAVVLFILFNRGKTRNLEIYLEIGVDAQRYIDNIEKNHKETNDQNVYHLRLAYAYTYHKEEYENAKGHFEQVVLDDTPHNDVFYKIYSRIKAKLAYEEQDELALKQQLNELTENEEQDEILVNYTKLLLLLLQENWELAIVNMMDNIPNQRARVHIIELEYYLAYAYNKEERYEDAKAVCEFVVKKGYRVRYTDLCYDLYLEVKDKVPEETPEEIQGEINE